MSQIMKINAKNVSFKPAVNAKADLPIEGSQNYDVRYVKVEDVSYLFNGARWVAVEIV